MFLGGISAPTALAADSAYLYWGTGAGTIGRVNKDGSGVEPSFITGASYVTALAVDGGHIYWADHVSGRIGRANLDGSAVNQSFITGARSPAGVAANGQYVFWTNWGMYGLDSIGRANADGSGVTPSLIGSRSFPRGLAISGDYIYWTERVPGPIGPEGGEPDTDYVLRAHLDGSGAWSIVDAGTDDLFGTAVDAAHVYWINRRGTPSVGPTRTAAVPPRASSRRPCRRRSRSPSIPSRAVRRPARRCRPSRSSAGTAAGPGTRASRTRASA